MTNVWHHWPGIDEDVAAIFDPFGNAVHTALAFPVLGEDVLITGAGPIGLMATAVVRHAGARFVVVSRAQPRAPRAGRARWARRSPSTRATRDLADVQQELGMVEGFDVALEMSGAPAAIRSAMDNMAHGGSIAILGIPTQDISLDVNEIVFKLLTIRGIYGREMYETWYKMTVMLQSGLDIAPAITHRFPFRDHEARVRHGALGRLRQGDHGLDARRAPRPTRRPMDTASLPNPLAFLDDELAALRERHLYRPLRIMSSAQGPIVSLDDRRVISLSSNDYLGLSHHPRMKRAAIEAVEQYGAGSGAVRTIAGTMTLHEALEAELAAFKHTEAVLTFQSGFTANTGVIPTITGETDLIVSDELNHASHHRRHAALEGAAQGLPARRRRLAARRSSRRRRRRAATAPASRTG